MRGIRKRSATQSPEGTVEQRLATRRLQLRPAELQAASYFVDVPEDVAFLSAAEIAGKLGVSDATVIRAAQALGYSGLGELKRELIETVRTRMNPTRQAARSLKGVSDDMARVLDQVLDLQIASLEDARRILSRSDFARAVAIMAAAARIHVVGFGPTGVLAEYMRTRLTRIGRQASAANQAGFLFAESLLWMRKGDVLLLIAHGTYSGEVDAALDHGSQLGIPIVLLTDLVSAIPRSRVAVALAARRSSAGLLHSPAMTLVLLDALLLGLAVQDRPGTLANLEALQQLRRSIARRQGSADHEETLMYDSLHDGRGAGARKATSLGGDGRAAPGSAPPPPPAR